VKRNKLKSLRLWIFSSAVVFGIIWGNVYLLIILNFVPPILFNTDERGKVPYFKKPKFLLFVTVVTFLPLLFTFGEKSSFFSTLELVLRTLFRGMLILQTMAILFNKINKDKVITHLNQKFPDFNQTLNETIETMKGFKNNLAESKKSFNKKKLLKAILSPKTTLQNLLSRLWKDYLKS